MKTKAPISPLHFIGMGGCGMKGLALYAKCAGYEVQGSDTKLPAELSSVIGQSFPQHHPDQLGVAKTVVYSSAIPDDNCELVEAKKRGLIILHRSDLLAYFLSQKKGITICGTHGKTTTSAMFETVLNSTTPQASAIVGGTLKAHDASFVYNDGPFLVAESDESDGTLVKYKPFIAVVNNIAKDHMEFFGDTDKLSACFLQHLDGLHKDGVALISWDDDLCRTLGHAYNGYKLSYGFNIGCDVRALSYEIRNGQTHYDVMVVKERVQGTLPTLGRHNLQNALACFAMAHFLKLDLDSVKNALQGFQGVGRRCDVISTSTEKIVIDDYAHNPGKIHAVISSLRESWPDWHLRVFFQPHRYSRLKTTCAEFCASFGSADEVYVLPLYAAGEPVDVSYDSARFAKEISSASNVRAFAIESFENAIEIAHNEVSKCINLTLGAGDINSLAPKL